MINTDNTAAPAPAPADPELIPLAAFLRRFSVSKSSFYRLASRGEAPDVVKLGRATFIPLAAARAWLQSRVIPAVTLSQSVRREA
jgi:predicted DNA-binding transcriptional regulator AlpA